MLINRTNVFIKELTHLPLRQPYGLVPFVQTHIDRLIGILVDQDL